MAKPDTAARRIAEKGRDTLRERLQSAFEEAAAAHADVLVVDTEGLERMVAHAVQRADGLQWRRALAVAATEELGIELGEALDHPAVARAHKIVGAPSYEEGLAAVAAGKPPPPGTGLPPDGNDGDSDLEAEERAAPQDGQGEEQGWPLSLDAVHVEGLPDLESRAEVVLAFSEDDLKVLRAGAGEVLVSFTWDQVGAVDVQLRRGRLWRRRWARLTVSAKGYETKFDAVDATPEDLERRLAPARSRLAERGRDG